MAYEIVPKGRRRLVLDFIRIVGGEPEKNRHSNRSRHCRYPAGSRKLFRRNKGHQRFKTGRRRG